MTFRKSAHEITRDPMQEFADRIVAELEKGIKPWVRPWDQDKCAGPQAPLNPTTGQHYHGVNVLILAMHPLPFMTADPRWMPTARGAALFARKMRCWEPTAANRANLTSQALPYRRCSLPAHAGIVAQVSLFILHR
jgi:antirestriction protein ArdC